VTRLLATGFFIFRFVIKHMSLVAVIGFVFIGKPGHAAYPRSDIAVPPEAIVLVLSGVGPFDQVAINYDNSVSRKRIEEDIREIKRVSGWPVRNLEIVTRKDSTPGAKPVTSSQFEVPPVANKAEGTLPLEPFIAALRRFQSIQVIYLVMGEFRFRGLKDFENDYIKIKLKQRKGAYTYNIQIKNSRFDDLNLPLKEERSAEMQKTNISAVARFIIVLMVAVVGGALVYLIASYLSKSSTNR
jgi:hypothetical protein